MIQTIQLLRFVAALWVAVFHAQHWGYFPQLPGWLQAIAAGGYAGVDIFFVISGAIMALSTQHSPPGPRSAGQFVLTRFARIYTGWWPVMALSIAALSALALLPAQTNLLASALLYPSNFSLHISNVIWTLVYELYFYLLVGASLLLPRRWRVPAMTTLAAAMLVWVLYCWALGRYEPSAFGQATLLLWFFAAPLVLEFFAGYLLFHWLQRHPRQHWGAWLLAAAVLAGAAVYMAWFHSPNAPGMAGFFHWPERALWAGSAATALLGAALLAPAPQWRSVQWLSRLGDYSFAIYLIHPLLLVLAARGLQALGWPHQPSMLATLGVLLLLVASSALYYHAIEHPLYQASRRLIARGLAPKT